MPEDGLRASEEEFWSSVDDELEGLPFGVDVDHTALPADTGKAWFSEAGIENFDDIVAWVDNNLPRGHSNQLNTFMYCAMRDFPAVVQHLYSHISDIEVEPREGLNTILDYRTGIEAPNIASSAGHAPVIDHVTNGHFDLKIAGGITPEGPVYNGEAEKKRNMEAALEDMGIGDIPIVFIGDSPGDRGGFELAYELGGYAVAVGEDRDVLEEVEDASFYVVDDTPHYTSAAILNELAHRPGYRMRPDDMRDFEISGEVYVGDMVDDLRYENIEAAAERIGVGLSHV